MLRYPHLKQEAEDLLEAKEYRILKAWFRTWNGPAGEFDLELFVDKVLIWCHIFLSDYFLDESPEFHRDLVKAFFSGKDEYTAAPRGFSKTTLLQGCICFSIISRIDTFIVLIEKTFNEAAEVLDAVHSIFLDNQLVLIVYGKLIGEILYNDIKNNYLKKNQTRKYPEAKGNLLINGIRLKGRGFNKSIRGLKVKQHRPSRIILDDIEEDEHINNPEQRLKYQKNFTRGVQPAIDIKGSIKMFGTILHVDSLLQNLINSHHGKIYSAHSGEDPATAPEDSFLWPQRWSREKLIKKKNDMSINGQSTAAYAQEYLNKPQSEQDRKFKFDWLWEMVPAPDDPKNSYRVPKHRITMAEFEKIRQRTVLNGYAMIDVADSTSDSSDDTAAVVIFVAPNGARFRVDVRKEKRNNLGLIQLIFQIWEKWLPYGLIKIGVEKKAFADQVLPLFNMEKERRQNVFPVIEELKPMGRNKEGRILGNLQGFYETGRMISICTPDQNGYLRAVGDTDKLLEQLYDFPAAKNDDLSDAEAYQGDIVVVPHAEDNIPMRHHNPQDDPFKGDEENFAGVGVPSTMVGGFDDPDAYG